MLLNIVLLFLIFGASKKKLSPNASGAIYGAIKAVLAYIASASPVIAVIYFAIYGALAVGMLHLLARLDRKEITENSISDYSLKRKTSFKWEYVPLSAIVLFLLFGELLVTLFA